MDQEAAQIALPPRLMQDLPPWQRYLVLLVVFAITAALALQIVAPINDFDWRMFSQGLRYQLSGQNPYPLGWELEEHYEFYYPPWAALFFWPLANAPVDWIVALDVAILIVLVLDVGRPPALLLILQPMFYLLLASGNIELLSGGLGVWLILLDVKGWKRGLALLLLAIKPQTMILLLLLEGIRTLVERDWRAIAVAGGIGGVALGAFPLWLPNVFWNQHGAGGSSFSIIGAGGLPMALLFTVAVLILMWKRWDEWRALAILLSLVWTPYVMPFSYVTLFFVMLRSAWWRVVAFVGGSIALLPVFFYDYHSKERVGVAMFLLMAALLSQRDATQTETAIAEVRGGEPLPERVKRIAARIVVRFRAQETERL
jgi:hypothetical protein